MSEWISVKDRLPEDSHRVLTCDHRGNINIMFHYDYYKKPFGIDKNHKVYFPVKYWMPLPEPPKECSL